MTVANRFWAKVKKTEKCWEWTGSLRKGGYGKIMIEDGIRPSGKRRQKDLSVHRLSYELHNGPIPKGACVCHKCDNRICIRPDHLFLGSIAENIKDMDKKGRRAFGCKVANPGEKNPAAKLTESDILKIRSQYKMTKLSQEKISREFNVSQTLISKIIRKKIWTHI